MSTGDKVMDNSGTMVKVMQPTGALTAASAEAFRQELVAVLSSETASELVVDMSQVESLDSAGLVSLISALNLAQSQSKRLSLYSVPPSIRIVFELAQLDQVFTLVDTASPAAALAA